MESAIANKFWRCAVCDFNFINKSALLQHAKAVHPSRPLEEVVGTMEEDATVEEPEELNTDEIIEADDSPVYLCSDCGVLFLTSEKMEEHCALVHPATVIEKRIFECSECRKRYDTEELFDQHHCYEPEPDGKTAERVQSQSKTIPMVIPYSDNSELNCDICETMFASKYALRRHIDIVHSGRKPMKKFKSPKRTADGWHLCGRCPASFPDMRALKAHSVSVHKMKWNNVRERTPQTCPVCSKVFSSTGNLNKHLKAVHRQEPLKMDIQAHLKKAQKDVEAVMKSVDPAQREVISAAHEVDTEPSPRVNVNFASCRKVRRSGRRLRRRRSSEESVSIVDIHPTEDDDENPESDSGKTSEMPNSNTEKTSETQSGEALNPNATASKEATPPSIANDDQVEIHSTVVVAGPQEVEVSQRDPKVLGGYVLQLDESLYAAMELGELHVVIEDNTEKNKENVEDQSIAQEKTKSVKSCKKSRDDPNWYWFCHPCAIQFDDKEALIVHYRRDHLPVDCEPDTGSSQQCDVCLKIFSTKGNREKHVYTVHRIPSRRVSNVGKLSEGQSQARLQCEECEKNFSSRGNLVKHIRFEHPNLAITPPKLNIDTTEEDKTCEICGKQFSTLLKKEMHVYNHNRSNKIHKCSQCDKTFNRIDYLKEHFDKKHGQPKYKCTYCDKRFVRKGYQVVHERVHTNERPYRCKICGKGFKQWGGLHQHQRFHAPKPPATHFCKHCHKGYSYKADLDRHLIIHSDRKHVCEYCSRPFPTASQLTVHVRTHTGQRPYKCQVCTMCFMTMGGLKRHQQIHERREVGSFICAICGASYRRQSSMDEHIRVFHQSEEQCIEEAVVDLEGGAHGEEVIEFIVQEDGTVQLTQGDLQALARCDNNWVETSDLEKELVEGIFASQASEHTLPIITVPVVASQENEVS